MSRCLAMTLIVLSVAGVAGAPLRADPPADRESGVVTSDPQMRVLGEHRAKAVEEYGQLSGLCTEWLALSPRERGTQYQRGRRDGIIGQFEAFIRTFPKTELAALAMRDILSLHSASGDAAAARAAYGRIVTEFPRTSHEMGAHMFMAIESVNRYHDPGRAIEYFSRIPDPRKTPYRLVGPGGRPLSHKQGELSAEESYYVSSRLKIIRCHLQLDQLAKAKEIAGDLQAGFPAARRWVDKTLRLYNVEAFEIPTETLPTVRDIDDAVQMALADEGFDSTEGVNTDDVSTAVTDGDRSNAPPPVSEVQVQVKGSADRQALEGRRVAAPPYSRRKVAGVSLLVAGSGCVGLGLFLGFIRHRQGRLHSGSEEQGKGG